MKTENTRKRIAVVGAGLSGATLAYELMSRGYQDITVFEQRNHVAGNAHTERCRQTNIMLHVYGPHIFHTDNERVWKWFGQFAEMVPHVQRTKGIVRGEVYSLPINLHTINQFLRKDLSPVEARDYIKTSTLGYQRPQDARNFEEFGIGTLGPQLYNAFIRSYTEKQWGIDPRELPASILKRLPFRLDYNDNAFNHKFQGIPHGGYTEAVKNMLDFPDITLRLGTKFDPDHADRGFDHVFYTGPLDEWFFHRHGRLRYRSLSFQKIVRLGIQDLQGCAVMNNCDPETKWTRRTEHKHFTPWEVHTGTVITQEVPRDHQPGDTDYFYPMRLDRDKEKLAKYEAEAAQETRTTFVGRLATYRYLDMDQCIKEAMDAADKFYRADNGYPPKEDDAPRYVT